MKSPAIELTEAELALAVERNFVDSWLHFATLDPETELFDDRGVRGFITGFDAPLLNAVVRTRAAEDEADELIDRTLRRFTDLGLPASWWILPSDEPADLGERLIGRGLLDAGSMPGMAIDLEANGFEGARTRITAQASTPRAPAVEGFEIEPVEDEDALAEFLAVAIPALQAPDDFGTIFIRTVVAEGFGPGRLIRNYIGRIDSLPVATSTLIAGGGIAGIYNVATESHYRRRGLGAAMTLAALEEGRRLGFRIGALQSTELGHSVYCGLGFRDVCTIRLLVLNTMGSTSP